MIDKKIKEFMLCLEEERYYNAHEVLEEVWFPRRFEESAEVKLLKGFINAAVSFELAKKGRIPQSKKVWANYLKYRQFLYKTDSPHLNNYYKLSRHIDNINKMKT
ncbi:DUF309 domain-containing protein [Sulfurimonas sp.]